MQAFAIRGGVAVLALAAAFGQSQDKQTQPQLEFEVASVRPAPPPAPGTLRGMRGGPGTEDPGQFTATNAILRNLLLRAYGLSNDQISGPGWMDTEQYTIVAKVPPGATSEQFQEMLRNLLTDRFKISARLVKKDFDGYELTVAKGGLKMKESAIDPKLDSGAPPPERLTIGPNGVVAGSPAPLTFKEGFPEIAPGNTPFLRGINVNGRELITARQQTMDQVVRTLQSALGAGTRVVDQTGLTGKYDFRLQYARSNNNAAAAAQSLPPGADFLDSIGEPAPDPVTAAQQQLGLHLEKHKIQVDVLVVDRADKAPTPN